MKSSVVGVLGVLAMAFTTVSMGCGDDGIKAGGRPVLEVYNLTRPVPMNGTVTVSGQVPANITIKNTGTSDLMIYGITTQSTPENVFVTLVDPTPSQAAPLVLKPDQSEYIDVLFDTSLPAGDHPTATVSIMTNATISGATTFVFRVTPEASSGRLMASPSTVDFSDVQAGETIIKPLSLVNVGSATLAVTRIVLSGHAGYEITIGGEHYVLDQTSAAGITLAAPISIGPSAAIEAELKYTASGPEEATADLIVFSDDTTTPDGTPVRLIANSEGPCIHVNPERVEFGPKLIGQEAIIPVDIESCGTGELNVQDIQMIETANGKYSVDLTGVTLPIAVGDKITVNVKYLPSEVATLGANGEFIRDLGKLKITSNAYLRDVTVDVSGFGTDGSCPTPVITCSEGNEVIPQTTLHCSASASTAGSGSITGYQWSVRQPNGSAETIRPSSTQRDIQFTANIIGTYTFVLDVFDQFGTKSCESKEYQVFVTSGEAIHVELIWHTPGDINETDTGFTIGGTSVGSDVDLHVLHPNASAYFDGTYDCYWLNKNPNWAGQGSLDDPRLDRDDTDGAGPENFNLNQPQFNTTYTVGAHYWDDWGFGNAFTTVRVYIYGQLRFTWNEVSLQHHDMWDVCTIDWPSGNVTAIGGTSPSIRHNYPIPF